MERYLLELCLSSDCIRDSRPPVVAEIGDRANEIGRDQLTIPSSDGDTTQEIKYVVVWRRAEDGWRWDVDIWNESP